MNLFYDANEIYDAGTKAIASAKWKYQSQKYRRDQLLETALLQQEMIGGKYKPQAGLEFTIHERGKVRHIVSNSVRDKTVYHMVSDLILEPSIHNYVTAENTASQVRKGVALFRKQLVRDLHHYYNTHGSNNGWILLTDFSGYYPNMNHDSCRETLSKFIDLHGFNSDTADTAKRIINQMLNRFGTGIDIGSQPSQEIGIIMPYRIDNYGRKVSLYGRYTDDIRAISDSKDTLECLLAYIRKEADMIGLIVNEKKTKIQRLNRPFRILQVQYRLTETGKVVQKINPKAIKRERDRLKAYRRLLDRGVLTYNDIETAYKSWLAMHHKIMSYRQIGNINDLYESLFGRRPTWKRHTRLRWLTARSSTDLAAMVTTT